MWKPIQWVVDWWKKNQEENSERGVERKELKENLIEDAKDIEAIDNSPIMDFQERRFEKAILIQNLHMQRKLTEATDGLKTATWILALATGIFAWVAIKDSPHSSEIINTLQQIAEVVGYLLIIGLAIVVGWKVLKVIWHILVWLFRFISKQISKR